MVKKIFHTIWYGFDEKKNYNEIHNTIKYIYEIDQLSIKKHEYVYSSNYHVEINLLHYPHSSIYDWIDEFSCTDHVTNKTKLVMLRNFDSLQLSIQQAFRTLLEDRNIRVYITCLWIDKIDDAIQSRCVCIPVLCDKINKSDELLKIVNQKINKYNISKWLTYCSSSLFIRNRFNTYNYSPSNLNELYVNSVYCPNKNEYNYLLDLP